MPTNGTLSSRAMLVDLTIKKWAASKQDKSISREVAQNHNSDPTMGRYQKQLVAKEALETINRIAGDAYAEHRKRTLAWADNGARVLPADGYMDYAQVMRAFKGQFDNAVSDLSADWDRFVRDASTRVPNFSWSEYPDASQIRDRYAFGYNLFPLPDTEDFRIVLGNGEVQRIKDDYAATLNAWQDQALVEAMSRIKEVVGHMAERLHAYEATASGVKNSFHGSLVENIRELLNVLPGLNVTKNRDLDGIINEMQDLVIHSAVELKADQVTREAVAEKADAILEKMAAFV